VEETLFLLGLAEKTDRIAGVVGGVDLVSPKLSERLEFFSRFEKLRGFRHMAQSEPDDRFLMRPEFVRGIALLREFGFAYDILVYPHQLPAAIDLVGELPEQRFVLDHLAKPDLKLKKIDSWASQMRQAASHPNLHCKLSGMVTEADWKSWSSADLAPYLDVVFEAFGPSRLMFGSDWPVCLCAATYSQVMGTLEAYVDRYFPNAKPAIFGDNANEFYGLRPRRR
jgi:L-fuconolactonase